MFNQKQERVIMVDIVLLHMDDRELKIILCTMVGKDMAKCI